MTDKPKISIVTPSRNTGRFARETIGSVQVQTFTAWEHIVVDGLSTDGTQEVLKQYPHLRWVSEADSGPDEAFIKGFKMARGEYVMFCAFSDGYLDKNWLKKCAELLDSRPEISLVWGLPQYLSEDGTLGRISYASFLDNPPPQGTEFVYHWLKTCFHFPEGNFCVRKNVLEDCFPVVDPKEVGKECEMLTFNYNFNTRGYLPHFIPAVVNYGRIHQDAGGQQQLASGKMQLWGVRYHNDIEQYKKRLASGEAVHRYRDGTGHLLPDAFDFERILKLERREKLKEGIKFFVPPAVSWLVKKILPRPGKP